MTFCVDTSAWLDGWVRDYPEDVFPSLWAKLSECITTGQIKCSEEVYVELEKKDDGIHDWLKRHKEVVVPINEEIQHLVAELLKDHPRLVDTHRQRSQADPFVIATAEILKATVVTGEKPRGKLDIPKIPDVCQQRQIPCIRFCKCCANWIGNSDMTDCRRSAGNHVAHLTEPAQTRGNQISAAPRAHRCSSSA